MSSVPRIEEGERFIGLRRRAEAVAEGASLLAPKDRAVVELVLRRGTTKQEVSRLLGLPPRSVARRLDRVLRRMQGVRFKFVASNMGRWSPQRRRIATQCVLHGRSLRRAAAELGVPVHEVRREMIAIEAMVEGGD